LNRHPDRARGASGRLITHAHSEVVPVPQHRDSLQLRDCLFDERETLGRERRRVIGNAGDGAARPCQPVDKVGGDRIAAAEGDNRSNVRNLAGEYYWKTRGYDDIDLVRLHRADDLRELTDLTTRSPRVQC